MSVLQLLVVVLILLEILRFVYLALKSHKNQGLRHAYTLVQLLKQKWQ